MYKLLPWNILKHLFKYFIIDNNPCTQAAIFFTAKYKIFLLYSNGHLVFLQESTKSKIVPNIYKLLITIQWVDVYLMNQSKLMN